MSQMLTAGTEYDGGVSLRKPPHSRSEPHRNGKGLAPLEWCEPWHWRRSQGLAEKRLDPVELVCAVDAEHSADSGTVSVQAEGVDGHQRVANQAGTS